MRALVLLTVLLTLSSLPATASGTETTSPTTGITHRIVWDEYLEGQNGVHLRTAAPDGSDPRRLYDTEIGFTLDLTLNHRGDHVAFAECCRVGFRRLTVVDVNDGTVLDPLAEHRRAIWSVRAIGFSPDDTRIAFEATSKNREGEGTLAALWTVGVDGSGLQRVLSLPWDPDGGIVRHNPALVWTADGILYSDGSDLRLATLPEDPSEEGSSSVVIPHVLQVRGSGDGGSIVTMRSAGEGHYAAWISAPDGSAARRLFRRPSGFEKPRITNVTPNYVGSHVIALRHSLGRRPDAILAWPVDGSPAQARELPLPEPWATVTWN